jgi:RNA polymerase sigma-70 factor, ECF subfamily
MSVIGITIDTLLLRILQGTESRSQKQIPALWCACGEEPSAVLDDPDVQLFLSYIGGNKHAFRMLFEKWKLPLISYFYRSIGDRESAEELALDVFRKLHQSNHRYQPEAKFPTYLFFIARRLLLNHSRKMRRKPLDFYDPQELVSVVGESSYDEDFSQEQEQTLMMVLGQLSEKYRTPLLLTLQQGMQPRDVAGIIGKSENSTRVLLHRGRQQLKNLLETWK